MRITHQIIRLDIYHFKHTLHNFFAFFLRRNAMRLQWLLKRFINLLLRIKCGIWILENHLDFFTEFKHLLFIELGNIFIVPVIIKHNLSACRFFKHHDRFSKCRFTASGLSYNTKCFTSVNIETYIIYRLNMSNHLFHKSLCNREPGLEIADLKDNFFIFCTHINPPPDKNHISGSVHGGPVRFHTSVLFFHGTGLYTRNICPQIHSRLSNLPDLE